MKTTKFGAVLSGIVIAGGLVAWPPDSAKGSSGLENFSRQEALEKTLKTLSENCSKDCRGISIRLSIVRDSRKGEKIHRTFLTTADFLAVNTVSVPLSAAVAVPFVRSIRTSLTPEGKLIEKIDPGQTVVGYSAVLTPVIDKKTGNIRVSYDLSCSRLDKMISKSVQGLIVQFPVVSVPIRISGVASLSGSKKSMVIYSDKNGYAVLLSANEEK